MDLGINHNIPWGRKKTQMERDGEGKGSIAVREGNFLHCSASDLQSDNQFMNVDPSVSFEVSE